MRPADDFSYAQLSNSREYGPIAAGAFSVLITFIIISSLSLSSAAFILNSAPSDVKCILRKSFHFSADML